MARIRKIEINHFRGIHQLEWCPNPGVNCLFGPGDSGKSTILDAIDLCLGARRNIQFTDADFHRLDVEEPICITVTLGELDDELKNLEIYGMYARGFDASSAKVEDEPELRAETVLTVRLKVHSDLEPLWSLVSERAEAQGMARDLSWGDRMRLAPTRIGAIADYHLSWRRGSVLNRVSEERAEASAALAKVAREARAAFGDEAQGQLERTLEIVADTAKGLGVPVSENVKAMLDANSVSFTGGTISLHDEDGIPLRALGTGSTRLLIAGLQRKAADQSTIMLVDELEHGLEPHRITRLLGSLGAKEESPPLQVFMTTHSPVAIRELSGGQLFAVRSTAEGHQVQCVGTANDIQSTIRLYPEAFLASSIIICEGASEVGLVRGLDLYSTAKGRTAITALGTALVDGGGIDNLYKRAFPFQALGYRVAVVRDDDKKPTPDAESKFNVDGGVVISWREGRALEDELFISLTSDAILKLVERACELHGEELINDHIKSASQNATDLHMIRAEINAKQTTPSTRKVLGQAAKAKSAGWFKSISWMEGVACDIVGPDVLGADEGFRKLVKDIFAWIKNGK